MRKGLAVVAVVVAFVGLVTGPVGAQDEGPIEELIDFVLHCGPHADQPTVEAGEVTGTGSVSGCGSREVAVRVCLQYQGVTWPLCGRGEGTGSASASATAPCLPGVWWTVALHEGKEAVPSPVAVIPVQECFPLDD